MLTLHVLVQESVWWIRAGGCSPQYCAFSRGRSCLVSGTGNGFIDAWCAVMSSSCDDGLTSNRCTGRYGFRSGMEASAAGCWRPEACKTQPATNLQLTYVCHASNYVRPSCLQVVAPCPEVRESGGDNDAGRPSSRASPPISSLTAPLLRTCNGSNRCQERRHAKPC